MEYISSKENAKVKAFVKLLSSRGERIESGRFACEGARLCLQAVDSGVMVEQFFATAEAIERHSGIAGRISDAAEESFEISLAVAQKMSGQKTPQGFFCVCRTQPPRELSALIKPGGRYAVLHGLQDPGNVGAVIRSAQTLGVDGLLLSRDCPDIYSPKVLQSAMGGVFARNIAFYDEFEDLYRVFNQSGIPLFAFALSAGAKPVTECDFSAGGAVVIGNEGSGLPDAVISLCSACAVIPMKGDIGSLNAAAAACIAIWELTGRAI